MLKKQTPTLYWTPAATATKDVTSYVSKAGTCFWRNSVHFHHWDLHWVPVTLFNPHKVPVWESTGWRRSLQHWLGRVAFYANLLKSATSLFLFTLTPMLPKPDFLFSKRGFSFPPPQRSGDWVAKLCRSSDRINLWAYWTLTRRT